MSDRQIQVETDLRGQVAIVTGGGRGIGRATVLALAGAGAAVAVIARSKDQLAETVALAEECGGRAAAFPVDVTDAHAVQDMVVQVTRELGPVDLLVNNAGHGGEFGTLWEVDPETWWRCIDVNLRGPFLCTRAVLPGMVARASGRIVITTSGAGTQVSAGISAYGISKTAAFRLAENVAAEAGPFGISAFAIHPGQVRTAMVESQFSSEEARRWAPHLYDLVADGWMGQPAELGAALAVYLASGEADALSGCFISVDDDVVDMVSRAEEIQSNGWYRLGLQMQD